MWRTPGVGGPSVGRRAARRRGRLRSASSPPAVAGRGVLPEARMPTIGTARVRKRQLPNRYMASTMQRRLREPASQLPQ